MRQLILCLLTAIAVAGGATADATVPTQDKKGTTDHPVIGRIPGSFIVSQVKRGFDEVVFPTTVLTRKDGRDTQNNVRYGPDEAVTVTGARLRTVYLNAANVGPVQAVLPYEQVFEAEGGERLFTCKVEDCGGNARRSSSGGGGKMSLAMYLWPSENVPYQFFDTEYCAQTMGITDQRYTVWKLPKQSSYVFVFAYTLTRGSFCGKISNRTVTVLDVVQENKLKLELDVVTRSQMAEEIATSGKIALYGLNFDSGQAALRPGSAPTLAEIGGLMQADAEIRLLIVGHTDAVGSFDYNQKLSERRAASVVTALRSQFGIEKSRLHPVGVSFASPLSDNSTEQGRAKNRRVELVKF